MKGAWRCVLLYQLTYLPGFAMFSTQGLLLLLLRVHWPKVWCNLLVDLVAWVWNIKLFLWTWNLVAFPNKSSKLLRPHPWNILKSFPSHAWAETIYKKRHWIFTRTLFSGGFKNIIVLCKSPYFTNLNKGHLEMIPLIYHDSQASVAGFGRQQNRIIYPDLWHVYNCVYIYIHIYGI